MEHTAAAIIDDKGADKIAVALQVPVGTVRVWKHRNRIPRTVWPELVEAFPDLTLESLKASEISAAAA